MSEEGLKVHRFAAVLPEQLLTEAGRHRDAVVAADQRAVIRCLGDDLAGLVHDVSHSRIALSGSTSAVQRSTRGLHVCSYNLEVGQARLAGAGCRAGREPDGAPQKIRLDTQKSKYDVICPNPVCFSALTHFPYGPSPPQAAGAVFSVAFSRE